MHNLGANSTHQAGTKRETPNAFRPEDRSAKAPMHVTESMKSQKEMFDWQTSSVTPGASAEHVEVAIAIRNLAEADVSNAEPFA